VADALVTARLSTLTEPESAASRRTVTVLVPAARVTGTETVDQVSQEAVAGRLSRGPATPLIRVDRVRVTDCPSPPRALAYLIISR
jgi:hypothetical protein